MTSFALQVTRFGFAVLGRLAPGRAGKLAFWLFCRTPSRRPKTKAHAKTLARAEQEMRTAQYLDLCIHKGTVACYRFIPENPNGKTSLVVHGWGSRTADMLVIIKGLLQAGDTVVSVDLPGHGKSSGRTLDIARAIGAIDAAWRQYGPFHTMIGHSFGGAVLIGAASGVLACYPQRRPERIITIAAPHSFADVISGFCQMLRLRPKVRNKIETQIMEIACQPMTAFESKGLLETMPVTMLVIHAPDDKEVPFYSAEMMAAAGRHVKLCPASGLGHRRIIFNTGVATQVAAFASGKLL
ncbi:alpha/beta hydrolase [Ochrobactrum sp. CM-21-5]|nr:alpha/beta hydrolase [Ochrobactrum sp. CM-21-5]MBC2886454.1 alpha/beta hydrolase [Ochrobactrum sp. CM-21-5]